MAEEPRTRVAPEIEEGEWQVQGGLAYEAEAADAFVESAAIRNSGLDAPVANLEYSNPFGQDIERVWFDGKIVYAVELGELDVDPSSVKVAQEYQIVYDVELNEQGKPVKEPERVKGQYNIYDSVPGMEKYSPLWLFNYVIVPRDYQPNSLRSEADCLQSGYRIVRSTVIEN